MNYEQQRTARFKKVKKLRDSGMKWKDIAKKMGVSVARVNTMYLYEDNDMPDSVRLRVQLAYDNRCGMCETAKGSLDVHHMFSREHDFENLVLLCRLCHVFAHKLKRNNIDAYKNFLVKAAKKKHYVELYPSKSSSKTIKKNKK